MLVSCKALSAPSKTIISGLGIRALLEDGTTIIDACSGVGVACLGFSNNEVFQAITIQMGKMAFANASYFSSDPSSQLAQDVLEGHPGGLSKAIFFNSGGEATEAALKIALQYWAEKGEHQRIKIIARKYSYHGNTLGALSLSGHDEKREMYKDWLSDHVSFVDPCYSYRGMTHHMSEDAYVQALIQQVKDEIVRLGSRNVAAFVAETVPGSTLGCAPACSGYFYQLRALCDKYGILLILDEVFCGMGRTGTMHAWQQEDNFRGPDLQMISKAFGGGFVPISAVLIHETIATSIACGSGRIRHSQTFQCHPLACAAALEVQKIIKRDKLLLNVNAMGDELERQLQKQILPLTYVGDIRGRGLFRAVEFVLDKETKAQFPRSVRFSKAVMDVAFAHGLHIHGSHYKAGSLYNVEHVMICPPYIVNKDDVIEIVRKLKQAITTCVVGLDATIRESGSII